MDQVVERILAKPDAQAGTEALVILQTLMCLMREKNLLTRADIEELCERIAMRAAQAERDPFPCCAEVTRHAADEMERIKGYISRHYGGKHRRSDRWAPTRS